MEQRDRYVDGFIATVLGEIVQSLLAGFLDGFVCAPKPRLVYSEHFPLATVPVHKRRSDEKARIALPSIWLRHDPIRQLQIDHIGCQRSRHASALGQIRRRSIAHAAMRGLQSKQSAVRTWDTHGAAAIMSQREGHDASGDRVGAATGAAAAVVVGAIRVERRAEVGVEVRGVHA